MFFISLERCSKWWPAVQGHDACKVLADTQALLNMAMVHDIALQLEKEGAPNHIHGMNLARIRISSMEHDPHLAHTPSLASLASFLTEKLMRMPEELPPEQKGSGGRKGA